MIKNEELINILNTLGFEWYGFEDSIDGIGVLTYSTNEFVGFLGPYKHRSPRGLRIYFTPNSPMPRQIKYFDLQKVGF